MGARKMNAQNLSDETLGDLKLLAVVLIMVLHVSSVLCGSFGYIDPSWLDSSLFNYTCHGMGILTSSDECNLTVTDKEYRIRHVLRMAFIMMTSSVVTLYVISGMIACAMIFGLHKYVTYMSFLSVFIGVLYPGAAILAIVASVYVIASFPAWYGYSAVLCLSAGILMIVAYGGLFMYDFMHLQRRHRQKQAKTKPLFDLHRLDKNSVMDQADKLHDDPLKLTLGRADNTGQLNFLGTRGQTKQRSQYRKSKYPGQ